MSPPSIHATAVAIDEEALLIVGPSRSGKSRLAMALIARTTRALPVVLVGDDRILLYERGGRVVARPHPRIAGFAERRGLGIVAMDWRAEAPVGGIVELSGCSPSSTRGDVRAPYPALRQVPKLDLVRLEDDGPDRVLAWWGARGAAAASHLSEKRLPRDRTCAKD